MHSNHRHYNSAASTSAHCFLLAGHKGEQKILKGFGTKLVSTKKTKGAAFYIGTIENYYYNALKTINY